MDQSSYLSRTLWEYRGSCKYTDLTLICGDGSLPAHAVMLARLFSSFGINFSSREEVPECLFLPDLTMEEVKHALKALYLQNNADQLKTILKRITITVKLEVSDNVNERDLKEEIKSIVENSYSDDDDQDDNATNLLKIEENSKRKYQDDSEDIKRETIPVLKINKTLKTVEYKNNDQQPIPCNMCDETFTRKQDYKKHMQDMHEQDEEEILENWEKLKARLGKRKGKGTSNHFKGPDKSINVCEFCQKEIKHGYSQLKVHYALQHREELIIHHPEITLSTPCLECNLLFLGKADLNRHSHEKHGKLWNCETCGEDFPTKDKRLKHRQIEHADELDARGIPTGKRDQECPYCHKMYEKQLGHSRFRNTIHKHIFNVHKEKRSLHPEITALLTCDECDTELYDKKAYKDHKNIVHGENAKCEICSKVTRSQAALVLHMKVHANESHICEICSLEFKCIEYLRLHHSRMHVPQETLFPCKLCFYKKAQTAETLEKHMLENHSGVQYLCSRCPKSFKNADGRRSHENNVHGEKTEKCEECGKMFSNKFTLRHHINIVHIKKKDKICPHCGEAFMIGQSFQAHVLRHTNDRQFPCEVCGKAFLLQKHLDKHMNTHTMPYKCDQCDKSFGSKFLLNDHVKMKHDGIKHECRFNCGWNAWFRRQCLNHEKTCRLNPVPGAPYTVAVGTASSLTLERYHAKLNESSFQEQE